MKKGVTLIAILLLAVLLNGCKEDTAQENVMVSDSEYYIYYLDNKETQLVRESYKPAGTTMEEQIIEYTNAMKEKNPDNLTYKKALPTYVNMWTEEAVKDKQLTLYFNSDYRKLEGATEVLCRAAIVKTFSQIKGVEYVQFNVDGQPLKDSNDVPVGFMKAEDFIDNTGGETKYEQNAVVTLYFADAEGRKLVDTRVKIKFDGTIPLEQLVLNQLMKGPACIEGVEDKEIQQTIPDKTVLNKVTVKDGICYVDFSSQFLKGREGISNDVIIYSIANSLIEITVINKVQFTIDGSQDIVFGDKISLDVPIERNLDIVKKSE